MLSPAEHKRLKIEERFTYDNGEKDVKTWRH